MRRGPCWRTLRCTIRRFPLLDSFVMAAAGPDPPWPPLLKGGKLGGTFASGDVRSSIWKLSTGPPWPPLLKGRKSRNIRAGKSPLLVLQVFNSPLSGGLPMTLRSDRATLKFLAGVTPHAIVVLLLFGVGGLIVTANADDGALLETRGDQPVKSGGITSVTGGGASDDVEESRKVDDQLAPDIAVALAAADFECGARTRV